MTSRKSTEARRRRATDAEPDIQTWQEWLREAANGPLVRTIAAIVTLATILFAALQANDNASEALSTSKAARALAREARDDAIDAERRADSIVNRLQDINESIESFGDGVERAVRRGIRKGVRRATRESR